MRDKARDNEPERVRRAFACGKSRSTSLHPRTCQVFFSVFFSVFFAVFEGTMPETRPHDELARGTLTRLTQERDNAVAIWSPTGREIAFTSARARANSLGL